MRTGKWHLLFLLILILNMNLYAAESKITGSSEKGSAFIEKNKIDTLVLAKLRKEGIRPAKLCSDEVFIRRVYLDITGTLPPPGKVKIFLKNRGKNKRSILIDNLLNTKEFVDYQTLKWCDILRVKAEFPINLWPNAVQAYHRWIHDSIRKNKPYNQFARELLTSSGSNFRVPQVNFYRAIQGREPSSIANAVALTFMGSRISIWPEEKKSSMEKIFSRVSYKGTAEWKEVIVFPDPAPAEEFKATLPDGKKVLVMPDDDPREIFANWLITPENPWFNKNITNRVWSWLMGRGIIHEPDDIRDDNPASNPKLLAFLEKELINANYDLKHIYRIILNSRTYQQSSIPQSKNPDAGILFTYYQSRQIEAEVLIDALCNLTGTTESYSSPIPEPFTFIPEHNSTINLADGSITSQFLEMFGRPSRDTGLESERNNKPTDAQRLHMLNSTHIQNKLTKGKKLNALIRIYKNDSGKLINLLYINILSRYPTKDEFATAQKYFKSGEINIKDASTDLAWSLINTKEFLFRH
jgi:uncharacterized protein DUF1553/uncharacterized protein DUF1549